MSPNTVLPHGTKTPSNPDYDQEREDDSCLEILHEAVAEENGIVQVSVDPERASLTFDYDPSHVSDPAIARIADRVAPTFQHRFQTCTLRLGQRGGRACESCALALEQRTRQLPGVRRATASYRGGMLSLTYDEGLTSPAQLFRQVTDLGINAQPSAALLARPAEIVEPPPATLALIRRWLAADRLALIFTLITFVTMILGLVLEKFGPSPAAAVVFYAIAYATGGTFGLKAGLESLRALTIDVDLLMVLAAIGAAIVGAPFEGALLLFLFSLSNVLQNYAMDRTRNAIRALMKLRPTEALVRRGSRKVKLPLGQIVVGDRIVVRPGERLPLDGVVLEGESSVDQAPITGESMPVAKRAGDEVLAGTINQQGGLEIRVTKLAEHSTLAKLIKLVEEAQSEKAQTQRFIDKAEQYYALGVIVFTILAILVPTVILRQAFQPAFYRAMTLMVAASPCALVISTPAVILSAIGNGARRGVLFKGGVHLERAAGIKVIAFDKTGTLTLGRPQVTDVIPNRPIQPNGLSWPDDENDLLALAAAVEARSEHPLAQSILGAAKARGLPLQEAKGFQASAGLGVRARVGHEEILVGNLRYFEHAGEADVSVIRPKVERLQNEGKTAVLVARYGAHGQSLQFLGVLGIADVLRPDAAAVVRDLKRQGVEQVVMLTGDNALTAQAIASQAGVDDYFAELLPEDKVRIVKELRDTFGTVAMVGDGVNDAPALATAGLGIAMGAAGTDVALETADVVLMADDLRNIPYVIALSRQTRRTLVVNLSFAMAVVGALIAAVLAIQLPLPLSVVGHEGSTVLVSLNGLRLLAFRRKTTV
jgi:Zn2+/Cd2+-exporting ATPase